MYSSSQIGIQQSIPNSERYNHFALIWDKNSGDPFDKVMAMLESFTDWINWGAYEKEIKEVLETFSNKYSYKVRGLDYPTSHLIKYGYCNMIVSKDSIVFDIRFLLLLTSEKIDFNTIEPENDLAAIFKVIFDKTGIDPYLFGQKTELFSLYEKHKPRIVHYLTADNIFYVSKTWEGAIYQIICNDIEGDEKGFGKKESVMPETLLILRSFYQAKLINCLDIWNISKYFKSPDILMKKLINKEDGASLISETQFPELFESSIKNNSYYGFAQYLYCVTYNLDMQDCDWYHCEEISELIDLLIKFTNKKVDGVLLCAAIKHLGEKISQQEKSFNAMSLFCSSVSNFTIGRDARHDFYQLLINLINKISFFEDRDALIEIINKSINPCCEIALYRALQANSMDAAKYLLSEGIFKIDLKAYLKWNIRVTESINFETHDVDQTFIMRVLSSKHFVSSPSLLRECIKLLISHDPDCIKKKDSKGRDIFWYLNQLDKNDAIINQIQTIIIRAYFDGVFTFFCGQFDGSSNVGLLNNSDVVNRITADAVAVQLKFGGQGS